MSSKQRDFEHCLVIGGAGMLGYEIVRQLLGLGKTVRVLDLESAPGPVTESRIGDIRNRQDIESACEGIDVVFQTAAAVWNTVTPPRVYDEVNVGGNRIVIEACMRAGIRRLVYTSTMDVVVEGARPIVDGNESLPYPAKMPGDHYSRTKIIAEKMVLSANGPELATCALRPAGIYGPRDKYHLLNLVNAARKGMKFIIGSESARFSHVYSENAAHAHVLAAGCLYPSSPVAGRCYFITDHHPATNLFEFMRPLLSELGYDLPKKRIPYPLAYALARVNELVNPESNFNRFSVVQTCVDHTFVHSRAEADFGYRPVVSLEDSFSRTIEWFIKEGHAQVN